MNSEFPPDLQKELLDDFYAECDELLTSIRNSVVQLEASVERRESNPVLVEGLYRHLHSLKGISAIAGLRPAEVLAHAMEDQIRLLLRKEIVPGAVRTDDLLVGCNNLEQVVAAHRSGKPLPSIEAAMAKLGRSAPVKTPERPAPIETETPAETVDPVQAARARGLEIWRCAFTPSPELDRQGVNLASVRARLTSEGEILSVTPTVPKAGSIVFSFVVGFRSPPTGRPDWERDGTHLEPISPSPAQADPADIGSLTASHIVRVDLERLDDLMRITGELLIIRSRLEERLEALGDGDGAGLKEINLSLTRSLRELREAISRVRTVPIGEIFTRMPFAVRDLARKSQKKVRVIFEGQHTEVDKYIVERLKEPLLHLVRNAFVHGVEDPEERQTSGKSPEATIFLNARVVGEQLVVQIHDDGRGIDPAAIARKAALSGLPVPGTLDMNAILGILCLPGFSTRDEADLAAGRGVGMAVVANTLRELGGTLALDSEKGRRTVFTLRMPLTLAIGDAVIVALGGETYAIPPASVDEIIQVPSREVRTIHEAEFILYRGGLLPVVRLTEMFRRSHEATETLTLLVVTSDRGSTGLAVDRVLSQKEIVIRPLKDPLLHVRGISGATELGDGRPILILDAAEITRGVARAPVSADAAPDVA
ncbi:MAG TPA: chemotaxis protein CheA [Opitutaceae bacterium]|jgi:two-component system chemotaxis sensor kinase CheA